MDGCESRLFLRELLVKVARVSAPILKDMLALPITRTDVKFLTMVGKYGGGMRLFITSSQLTSLKNGCALISSASACPEPSRRVGSLVSSYVGGISPEVQSRQIS